MKITMTLNPASIAKAAKELEELSKKLRDSELKIDQRLSQIAAEEARNHYSGEVAVEALDHGVMAVGPGVVFEEFGAGARISNPYPSGADVDFEIRKGAYSDLHEGEYARSGYESWHYRGEEYRFVTPRNGLFYGMMEARQRAPEVVWEVLKDSW